MILGFKSSCDKQSMFITKMRLRTRTQKYLAAMLMACGAACPAPGQVAEPSTSLLNATRAIALNTKTGKVYAVASAQGAVSAFDPGKKATSSVKVGKGPVALAINEATNRIYIANNGSGSVSVIDGFSDAVVATVNVGALPYVLAVNAVTNKVFVSNTFSDVITLIDGATNVTSTIKAGSADSIVIDAERDRAYLVGWESTNLTVLDSKPSLVGKIPTKGMHVWGTFVDQAAGKVYATKAGQAELLIVGEDSGSVGAVPTGAIPCAIAVNPVTGAIYVVNHADDTVTVTGLANHKVAITIKVGKAPQGIVVDSKVNRIYVANVHSNSVTVIDGAGNTAINTLNVGKNPYALAVDEKSGRLYVALQGETPFVAIDPSAPAN